jgi:hypothetical protein
VLFVNVSKSALNNNRNFFSDIAYSYPTPSLTILCPEWGCGQGATVVSHGFVRGVCRAGDMFLVHPSRALIWRQQGGVLLRQLTDSPGLWALGCECCLNWSRCWGVPPLVCFPTSLPFLLYLRDTVVPSMVGGLFLTQGLLTLWMSGPGPFQIQEQSQCRNQLLKDSCRVCCLQHL